MRPIQLLALAAAITAAGTACGGDNGNGPDNDPPTAAFTVPACQADVACTFTDGSTDAEGAIASRSWTFETGVPATSVEASQAVTFPDPGTFTVTLTVSDGSGATDDVSQEVTVTGPAGNQPPVAGFTFDCSAFDCTFTNTSTDEGGLSYAWDFGDGQTSPNASPTHTYPPAADLTTFTVVLTVTDAQGLTATSTQEVTVSPPATLTCGATADCSLEIELPSIVTVTLVSSDCELSGNTLKVTITPPAGTPAEETLFTDGCNTPAGTTFQLQTGAVLATGTQITAQVISGGETLEIPPAINVTGDFASGWTLNYDDGARAGPAGGEPDFNDLVITIVATQ